MGKGYVLINRRIEDHWLWQDRPFSKGHAWIDLILMANYAPAEMLTKGVLVKIERGQVLRTIGFLAERWGWSAKKVRGFLNQVKGQTMVTLEGTPQGTLITIENYAFWQTLGQESGHSKGQPKGQTREHKRNKNNESLNKNKNNKGQSPTCCPSFLEVCEYVDEMDYKMDPAAFYDYYTEIGWTKKNGQPIKDWKATVRSWERRANEWKAKEEAKFNAKYKPYKAEVYKREPMPDDMKTKWLKGGGKK